MKKRIWIPLIALILMGAVFAQSKKETKSSYSISKWGQPQGEWGWTAEIRPHNIDLDPSGNLFIADVGAAGPSKMIWKMVKN